MKIRCCQYCGIPIRKEARKDYCGKWCQQLAEWSPCPLCGKRFLRSQNKQVYCSYKCAREKQSAEAKERRKRTCQTCGKEFIRRPPSGTANKGLSDEGKYCSVECRGKARRNPDKWFFVNGKRYKKGDSCTVFFKICCVCERLFTTRSQQAVKCSDKCRLQYHRDSTKKSNMIKHYQNITPLICGVCGKRFVPLYGDKSRRFCSESCQLKNIRRMNKKIRKNAKVRRRLKRQEKYIESVSVKYLYFRDGGRCQICKRKLNLKRTVPHSLAATIDHIIPLSKGGEHSKRNTQLVCFKCNSEKGNRVAKTGDQLLLFG